MEIGVLCGYLEAIEGKAIHGGISRGFKGLGFGIEFVVLGLRI